MGERKDVEKITTAFVSFTQMAFIVGSATAATIITCFATFVTKDAHSNEVSIRSKFRDEQYMEMKQDISDIKKDVRVILERIPNHR